MTGASPSDCLGSYPEHCWDTVDYAGFCLKNIEQQYLPNVKSVKIISMNNQHFKHFPFLSSVAYRFLWLGFASLCICLLRDIWWLLLGTKWQQVFSNRHPIASLQESSLYSIHYEYDHHLYISCL